jgi:hypothetical protein
MAQRILEASIAELLEYLADSGDFQTAALFCLFLGVDLIQTMGLSKQDAIEWVFAYIGLPSFCGT